MRPRRLNPNRSRLTRRLSTSLSPNLSRLWTRRSPHDLQTS